jgi:hypothetical protein
MINSLGMISKMSAKGLLGRMGSKHSDMFGTPRWPIISLLNALPEPLDGVVWEPACGKGRIVDTLLAMNQPCVGTDLLTGVNFLETTEPPEFDYLITNPPFSKKDAFLARCYELNKPFALLLPFAALEGKKRQALYRKYGVELVILPRRIDFEYPDGTFKGKPWFSGMFVTWGFNFGRGLTFA